MKSLDKKKTKELEYVITWVMAKANGIDDYNWGQKQFEKDLRKKLELLLTRQRTELLEEYFEKEDNLIDKHANLKDDNWDKFLEARSKLKINLLNKKND